jgi:polar amino acid transport system substrate-binding protein
MWLSLLVCYLGFSGCVGTSAVESVASNETLLRVGVTADAPPLIFKKGDAYAGLEAELAEELGRFLHKDVRFVEVPWEDQIQTLLDDRTDIIMSGISITPLREVLIAFSIPYFRTGQMALMASGEWPLPCDSALSQERPGNTLSKKISRGPKK